MGSIRSMQRETRRQEALAKDELISKIRNLLQAHAGAPDYLSRIVDDLTAEGISTLKGKAWTRRNLWGFLITNEGLFEEGFDISAEAVVMRKGGHEDSQALGRAGRIGTESLNSLVERYGWFPVAVSDSELLYRVEQRAQQEGRSVSTLIEDLLREWLDTQEEMDQGKGRSHALTESNADKIVQEVHETTTRTTTGIYETTTTTITGGSEEIGKLVQDDVLHGRHSLVVKNGGGRATD
ncbi:MAG: ribbon-helix-helix protein, CopG family [Desulfomonilaceae bacterium]